MLQITHRFFLCPACDGYGSFDNGHSPNSPYYDDSECIDCDGQGTQRLPIVTGHAQGLQPWGGPRGRSASRIRLPHTDPLQMMANSRAPARTALHAYRYLPVRKRAMRPVALPGGQR